jgi:hypothetical protein
LRFPQADAIVRSMKKASMISAMLLFTAASLFAAADLTGTWCAKVDLGAQKGSPTFNLKQEGEKLTGTYSGALGESQIRGTVKGNEVTWDFEASGVAVHYAGKISDDGSRIGGTVDYGGQASGTFVATRSEAKEKK